MDSCVVNHDGCQVIIVNDDGQKWQLVIWLRMVKDDGVIYGGGES